MYEEITEFVRVCEQCQKQGKMKKLISPNLQSIPVPPEVMKQIGIDICNLPEVDGFKHLVVCIDYFSKWSEAKPLKDKLATSVATFLYEIICRHGCMKIQINDQGREFVNEVMTQLHEMTGVDQRVTSAYHPQANGLCERQNRTIKDSLIKVLDAKATEWPYVIDGVLFAHRVSIHSSTKFSPFFLMYNRHPVLPIDIKYNLNSASVGAESDFDLDTFNSILSATLSLRDEKHKEASKNIKKAQEKQQKDYNRRHTVPSSIIKPKDEVLLKDQRRIDRKGGKFSFKWLGPYIVESITKSGLCELRNNRGIVLAKKYSISLLKPLEVPDEIDVDVSDEKPPNSPQDNVDFPDEMPFNSSQVNWSRLPEEIMEIILVKAVESSSNLVVTYNSLVGTCSRFRRLLKGRSGDILPRLYVQFPDEILEKLPTMNDNIKVSVRMIIKTFGPYSGIALSLKDEVMDRKWKSAWIILRHCSRKFWYNVERIYWKSPKGVPSTTITDDNKENVRNDDANDEVFWLQNDLYNLKKADQTIILSKEAWFNDNIMDAAQRIICKALDIEYQSVLNVQNKSTTPFYPVANAEHLQLLHDGSNHWLLSFCSNGRVQICDSLRNKLSRKSMKCIKSLFKHCVDNLGKPLVTFLPVQKQLDGYNCGPFAIAYAAEMLDGKSPMQARFDVRKMRRHVMTCLEAQALTPFPKM